MSGQILGGKNANKDDVLKTIQAMTAEQNLKMFIGQLHEVCFKRCISSPASSLGRNDEACIANCVRKFTSLHDTVSREWNTNIQRLQAQGGGVSGSF